jgi:hypothetical protein
MIVKADSKQTGLYSAWNNRKLGFGRVEMAYFKVNKNWNTNDSFYRKTSRTPCCLRDPIMF